MSDLPSIRRQLRIKTGVVKRLLKDHSVNRKELEEQKSKLDRFVAEHAEDWDVKNATKMMEESNKMIIDSETRLGNALEDLRDLVVFARKEPQLTEVEELLQAEEVLEGASS